MYAERVVLCNCRQLFQPVELVDCHDIVPSRDLQKTIANQPAESLSGGVPQYQQGKGYDLLLFIAHFIFYGRVGVK